ncbi:MULTISPECIES: hypothetical protein [unclassified Janthinobacterium]|uniref:hypothetical protein n=1 Tax=unclassified Janthinobacterium TaxID=2610881 RepID=UPI00111361AA|nr:MULTISPECIES: hypothetical protein [unclassified Janthinobacterium]
MKMKKRIGGKFIPSVGVHCSLLLAVSRSAKEPSPRVSVFTALLSIDSRKNHGQHECAGKLIALLRVLLNALDALGDVLRPTGFMRCKPCLSLSLGRAAIKRNFFNFFRGLPRRGFSAS